MSRSCSILKPSHPGALREIVPATGHSKTKVAQLLDVSRQTLYDVLAETAAVTPNLALRLGRLFGDGPEPWLRMQAAPDVWMLSRAIAAKSRQAAAHGGGIVSSCCRSSSCRAPATVPARPA